MLEADRGQALRERVVNLSARAAVRSSIRATCDGFARQPRAFDGDADLRGDRRQEVELAAGEPPPRGRGDVHDAERPFAEVQRDAGVIAQAARSRTVARRNCRAKAAALHDVDVAGRQLASA